MEYFRGSRDAEVEDCGPRLDMLSRGVGCTCCDFGLKKTCFATSVLPTICLFFLSCVEICHTRSCGNVKLFPDVRPFQYECIKQTLLMNDRLDVKIHRSSEKALFAITAVKYSTFRTARNFCSRLTEDKDFPDHLNLITIHPPAEPGL